VTVVAPAFPCPCCGYLTMPEQRGSYTYCEVCAWEDDELQAAEPDLAGGANRESLNEARANYRRLGVSAERKRSMVRAPLPDEIPGQ
jgi:hypothetical protein